MQAWILEVVGAPLWACHSQVGAVAGALGPLWRVTGGANVPCHPLPLALEALP